MTTDLPLNRIRHVLELTRGGENNTTLYTMYVIFAIQSHLTGSNVLQLRWGKVAANREKLAGWLLEGHPDGKQGKLKSSMCRQLLCTESSYE